METKAKRFFSMLLCAALVFALMPVMARAESSVDSADYAFNADTGTLTIKTNAATAHDSYSGRGPSHWTLNSSIPANEVLEVNILSGVTDIGAYAFSVARCPNLRTVTIPNSVTTIGDEAFFKCTSLESAALPDSVTTIGEKAFYMCNSLTSVTIPNKLTAINNSVFCLCNSIKSVVIPNSVTSIGDAAFSGCDTLQSVEIPNSVASIGFGAFSGCTSLTKVTIPRSVTSIDDDAFWDCPALSADGIYCYKYSVADDYCRGNNLPFRYITDGEAVITTTSLPNGMVGTAYSQALQAIGNETITWSLYNNTTLPDGLNLNTSTGEISGTPTALGTVTFTVKAENSSGSDTQEFSITTTLASGTTADGFVWEQTSATEAKITGYTGADTVITIPGTVINNIGTNLTVTSINERAFDSKSIVGVTIPSNVEVIGLSAFQQCSFLESVTFAADSKLKTISESAFSNCTALTSIAIPGNVEVIGRVAFQRCSSLASVTFAAGSKLNTISKGAFSYCTALTSIAIPAGVTTIESVFSNCTALTSITIPASVTSIGDYAFYGCTSLTSITIPAGVTSIGDYAFFDCTPLTSITIPAGVTSIGNSAFSDCRNLERVTIKSKTAAFGNDIFFRAALSNDGVYGYKDSTADTYCKAKNIPFHNLAVDITTTSLPNGMVGTAYSQTLQATSNESITWSIDSGSLPAGLNLNANTGEISGTATALGTATFTVKAENSSGSDTQEFSITTTLASGTTADGFVWEQTSATEAKITDYTGSGGNITIPSAVGHGNIPVTAITDGAFQNKTAITGVTIPGSVNTVGSGAFVGCKNIVTLTLNEGLQTIGVWAFGHSGDDAPKITELTIPSSVTSIGNAAFYGCHSLKKVLFKSKTAAINGNPLGATNLVADGVYGYKNSTADTYCRSRNYPFHYITDGEPVIAAATLPNGMVGTAYSQTLQAIGTAPITWSIDSGSLPAGLNLNANTGEITGKPTAQGTATFTVKAENSSGDDTQEFSITTTLASDTTADGFVWAQTSATEAKITGYTGSGGNITIPNAVGHGNIPVTAIADEAFKNKTAITGVTIPGSVNTVGSGAFVGCKNIVTLTLNEGLQTIGVWAFGHSGDDAPKITELTIPPSVTSIGNAAFYGCHSLKKVLFKSKTAAINGNPLGATNLVADGVYGYKDSTADTYCKANNIPFHYLANEATYTVTVNNGTGSGNYAQGATVTITANPAPNGQAFDKWMSSDDVIFANATSANTTFTMLGKDVTVTATYKNTDGVEPLVPSVSPGTLTVDKGGTASLTIAFGQGASRATGAEITVANGGIASVSQTQVTMPDTITVTGITVGTTDITVAFNDTPSTTATVSVTVRAVAPTDKTLVSITAPTAITGVANGTAKTASALGLPAKVTLVTDGGNVQADVSWDVASSSYNASSSRAQTFKVDGTVTLPNGVINPNTIPLTTSVSVSVKKSSSSGGGSNDGGSSGGSSGTTVTIQPEKKPDRPVMAGFSATPAVNSSGHATVTVSQESVADAIAKAQADAKAQGKSTNGIGISLNIDLPDRAKSLGIVLPQATLQSLVDAGVKQLEINGVIVSLDLDLEVLQEIQKQSMGDVTITIKPAQNLFEAAKKLIGTRPVYDVSVSYVKDGETVNITSLGKGSATLGISYTPDKNEAVGWLYGVYVDDNGNATRIPGSTYDANSGSLILNTGHLSVYGVGYTAPTEKYTDIATHWAKESIDYVVGRGLFSGTTDTSFSPNTAMDRGMLVTVLGRLFGADVSAYKTSSFSDVAAGKYYLPYVEWAYKKGIISGIGNGKFAPERAVTREEIAMILQNYAKVTGFRLPVTREAITFADNSSIASAYANAIRAMQQAGIMVGGSGNKFNPKAGATRAEVAAMLHRYVKLTIDPATAQGWALNDDGRYMYYKDGKPVTGWQTIDGVRYHFYSTGVLQTGWFKDGDNWRFYSGNRALTGWWDIGSETSKKRYYFDTNAVMVSGKWLQIDGKWYYFYGDGSLARGTKVDGYEVDENGVRKGK